MIGPSSRSDVTKCAVAPINLTPNAFLFINDFLITAKEQDSYDLILRIAKDKYSIEEIANWVSKRKTTMPDASGI
jgi:hypothetical protein